MTTLTKQSRQQPLRPLTPLAHAAVRNLAVLVVALAALSVWVYTQNTKRGTDLVAGSDFIKGLDVNKVASITLSFGAEGSASTDSESTDSKSKAQVKPKANIVLTRNGSGFVLSDQKSYPADTAKVNDLLFAIADIQVKKLVNNDASTAEREAMGLVPSTAHPRRSVRVQVTDDSGKALTGFTIGKDHQSGGSYLQKDGSSQVYLSKRSAFLAQSYKDFIDWTLVAIPSDSLERLEQSSPARVAEKLAGKWSFMDPAGGTPLPTEADKVQGWIQALSRVDFEGYYTLSAPEVQNVSFATKLSATLSNKMIYELALAKAGKQHFAKLTAKVAELPSEVTINPNDDKEKLAGIEDMLTAKERADAVNRQRSPWVYVISKADYDRLITAKDSPPQP